MFRKIQKMYDFNTNSRAWRSHRCGFTLVEIAAALMILSLLLGSTVVLMNRYVGTVIDLRLREHAFNLARSNMEILLTESRVSEKSETGTSEAYPDIDWQTTIEPFYEPVTDRMWIRAVCSAGFFDSQGERQDVELEHWITSLTAAQIKQILAQQKIEMNYLELLQGGEESAIIETTRAYLEKKGLDVEAYDRFVKKQRREKLKHLSEEGMDGYEEFLEELKEEENIFLEKLGMEFDEYNEFAMTYVPKAVSSDNDTLYNMDSGTSLGLGVGSNTGAGESNVQDTDNSSNNDSSDDMIDWSSIPEMWWPLFEQLGFDPPK